jgi:DNA-binding Lrp family transcriptional regulator
MEDENSELREISFKNYASIDLDVLTSFMFTMNKMDLGNLAKLIPLTKTDMNMLYNHSVPYTNTTLQKYLGIKSRAKFAELIKRLIEAGMIIRYPTKINNKKVVGFLMNPYFSRMRTTFNTELKELFSSFTFGKTLPDGVILKSEYKKQLTTTEWKNKREEVLEERGRCCERCESKTHLQIHHKEYIWGNKAWEYDNSYLEILCRSCHLKEHNFKDLG